MVAPFFSLDIGGEGKFIGSFKGGSKKKEAHYAWKSYSKARMNEEVYYSAQRKRADIMTEIRPVVYKNILY